MKPKDIYLLNEHLQEKHRKYRCEWCDFTKGLKIHNTESHTQYEYKCDKCDYSLYTGDITKHIKIVTVHQLYHYDTLWGVQESYERKTLTPQIITHNK